MWEKLPLKFQNLGKYIKNLTGGHDQVMGVGVVEETIVFDDLVLATCWVGFMFCETTFGGRCTDCM